MAVTRELVITYGAYVVGTTSGSLGPDGKIRLSKTYDEGSLEFSFIVTGADAATFAANCAAAETAFKKPYQDLTVTLDGSNLLLAQQSTGTALNPLPELSKDDHQADSGRSRRYTARITYGIAADSGAELASGLREYYIDASYDQAHRATVTLSGTFTAVGGSGATAMYVAGIGTLVAAAKSLLGITYWELDSEPSVRSDTNNKTCEFTRVYEEILFSQAGSSLDSTTFVRQRLSISRRREAPGDTPTAERMVILDLSYEAWVDKQQSTNLRSTYGGIRAWLVTQISETLNGSDFAIVEETPEYFYDENRISVRMTALGLTAGEDIIEQRVTVDDDDAKGIEFVPAWAGDALATYYYNGPRIVIRTITHNLKKLGKFTEQDALGFTATQVSTAKGRAPSGADGGEWIVFRQRPNATQLEMGLDADTIDVTEHQIITQMRYVKEPKAGTITPPSPPTTP